MDDKTEIKLSYKCAYESQDMFWVTLVQGHNSGTHTVNMAKEKKWQNT